ncbi:MAG: iron response transcriptional regulator IrrA [Rhabdaerophilum sp.]
MDHVIQKNAGAGLPGGNRPSVSLAGCPVHDLKHRLRAVGLRPTRQRVALGWLLFARGDRHLTAETLFDEAQRARVPVSLATIYNTLNQFSHVGLLRQIAMDGTRSYFDTNTSDHHHFFVEGDEKLVDIPGHDLSVSNLPEPPEGMEIARVEVVVRLRKKGT